MILQRILLLAVLLSATAGLSAVHAQPHPVVARPINGAVLGHLGEVISQPGNNGTGFAGPQTVGSPFGLQIMNASTVVNAAALGPGGVLQVQNPSIVFQFPITPDQNGYIATPGGLHFAYKTIGWLGTVAMQACLTPQEASAWPGAVAQPADPTCPTEDDVVHIKNLPRTWYQVAVAKVDTYVVQNGGFQFIPTNLPINLQQIVSPTRFHIDGYTLYYTNPHPGPNDYAAACPQNVCQVHALTNTAPFTVVVMPMAMIQLKVLPQTILYLPPGNASFATYSVTATYTTTLTAGNTTQIDNSQANDSWNEAIDTGGATASIAKIFDAGYSSSDDTRWDTKTTVKAGQALEHDISGQNQLQIVNLQKLTATASNVPGAAGTVANEPFWSDLVIMLVHPQFALWDFYGKTTLQLVAASSASTLPDEIGIPVSELDSCANATGNSAAGIDFFPTGAPKDTLNAADCRNLAALDPFYGQGQSADVSRRGTLFAATQPFGAATSGNPTPHLIDLKQIDSNQITITNQSTQTYASTVEDIVATTQSTGIKLGVSSGAIIPGLSLGLSQDFTLKQGSSSDTSATMTLTYKNSSVTTFRQDIAVEGSISDTINRGYSPMVAVYLDNVFGGLMFVDPTAPVVPCKPQPTCTVVNHNGQTLQRAP